MQNASTTSKKDNEEDLSTDSASGQVTKKRMGAHDDDESTNRRPLKKREITKSYSSSVLNRKNDKNNCLQTREECSGSENEGDSVSWNEDNSISDRGENMILTQNGSVVPGSPYACESFPESVCRLSSSLLQDTTRTQLQKCFCLVNEIKKEDALALSHAFAHKNLSWECIEDTATHDGAWPEFCEDELPSVSEQGRRDLRRLACISRYVRDFMTSSGIIAYDCHMSILQAIFESDLNISELLFLDKQDTSRWMELKLNLRRMDVKYGYINRFRFWTLTRLNEIRSKWIHMSLHVEQLSSGMHVYSFQYLYVCVYLYNLPSG
jgi:hypothetical protein